MARASKKEVAEPRAQLPVDWEDQMRRDAEIAAGMEARIGSSQFFSTKGGQLKFNDSPIPDNEMAVIVLDYVIEKTFYEDDYDPDSPASPVCFSFGRGDELDLIPHVDVSAKQAEACHGCEWNEFGSADRGSGKACKDARRLALIPAGKKTKDGDWDIDEDPEFYESQQFALLRLPPTSLKAWATYVKTLKGALGRPPYGVVTLIKLIPDVKNQFTFTFQALGKIPNEIGGVIMQKHHQCTEPNVVDFPYSPMADGEEKTTKTARGKGRGKTKAPAKGKTSARGRGARKY